MSRFESYELEDLEDEEVLQEVLEAVEAEVDDNEFVESICNQYREKGSLTEGQKAGILKFYNNLR